MYVVTLMEEIDVHKACGLHIAPSLSTNVFPHQAYSGLSYRSHSAASKLALVQSLLRRSPDV